MITIMIIIIMIMTIVIQLILIITIININEASGGSVAGGALTAVFLESLAEEAYQHCDLS